MIKIVRAFLILISLIFFSGNVSGGKFDLEGGEETSKQDSKIKHRYLAVFPGSNPRY